VTEAASTETPDETIPRPETLAQTVANRLRDEIKRGGIPAGERLRQADVARRLGISTTPVREAFALLRREGVLTGDAHRGAVVFRPTLADLDETYEMRIALEALATKRAVPNMTSADIAALRAILEESERLAPGDVENYLRVNAAFHSHLYDASRSPRLVSLIADLRDASMMYLRFLGADQSSADHGHAEHRAILAACEAGDAERAAAAVEDHLRNRLVTFAGQLST
jgi:DNA-binding GntR family transcriptional regulator